MSNNKSNTRNDGRSIEERGIEIGSRTPDYTLSTPTSKPIDIDLMTGQSNNNSSNNKNKE